MTETVVCVGAVVHRARQVLLVRQSPGHSLEGQWTIPWGELRPGESPSAAALRETREESSVVAEVEGLLGIQELPAPWVGMIGLLYLCRHVDGNAAPDNRETDAARYFDIEDLDDFSEPIEPLSAWLVRKVLNDNYALVRPDESNPFLPGMGYL